MSARMSKFSVFCLLVVCCATLGCKPKKYPEVSSKTLRSEAGIRAAINAIEPDLRTISYLFDGHVIFGLFRRGETNEYLLVLKPSMIGELNVSIGGRSISNAFDRPLKIMVGGEVILPDGNK